MYYTHVKINRDEMTGLVTRVGAWEVPILEAKHGSSKLEIGGLVEAKNRTWPEDPVSEMTRLGRVYGMRGTGDDAVSFAEFVYGSGSRGIKELAQAIDEARAAAEPKAKKGRVADDLVGAAG